MDQMAMDYQPGELAVIVFADGDEMLLGTLLEAGWKRHTYNYSAEVTPGSNVFWAFDIRQVEQLAGAVDGVSRKVDSLLGALSSRIVERFPSRESFVLAITPVASLLQTTA